MAAPVPTRDRTVFFIGAGVSSALGLPNTPSLIHEVLEFAKQKSWLASEALPSRLRESFRFFYPDAANAGFQPDVVDFFSTLRTYIDVGTGLPGVGLRNAAELFRSLKFAIAHLLLERIRAVDDRLANEGHPYLARVMRRGNVVITSNWDCLLERYAYRNDIPIRLSGFSNSEVAILKLHGSIDWCTVEDRRLGRSDGDYCSLREQVIAEGGRRLPLPKAGGELVRVKSLEHWGDAWRRIKSRSDSLHMVTMARSKAGDLGPLQDVWRDAYGALSRAERLEIAGYSMPEDDIEIRTLLRTGIKRGGDSPNVAVKNPSPDVHYRIRQYLDRNAKSDYLAVSPLGP